MATSGSATLQLCNRGVYCVDVYLSWSVNSSNVVSWNAHIPGPDGTDNSWICCQRFYVTGGKNSNNNISGDLTRNVSGGTCWGDDCHCTKLDNGWGIGGAYANGTISMGEGGGTLYLGYTADANDVAHSDYRTWTIDAIAWTASLSYNANGGSGGPSTQSHGGISNSTSSYNFTVSNTVPTRSGYRFEGWSTTSGGAVEYHGGDTFTVQKSNRSRTLYAVWTRIYDYILNYNANGGSGAPASDTYSTELTSHTFTVSSTIPTLAAHSFDGWMYNGVTYHGGDTITLTSANTTVTLDAQWLNSYRPGERKISGTWTSTNRQAGACERKTNGYWDDLRTIDGGTGTGDPPSRKSSGTWYNQRKCGQE